MDALFSPVSIGALPLPNRFVRSATHDFMADGQGRPTEAQVELLRALARGGVGLIVLGNACVSPEGRSVPAMLSLDGDGQIPGFARLAAAVHAEGPSRLLAQLNFGAADPVELPETDLSRLAAAAAAAAARVREAGLDGVQLHAAHGYLLNRMLSPLANHRADGFGGNLEGRARLLREILQAIRRRVGEEFPVLIKLASTDGQPGGLTLGQSVQIGRLAQDWGVDAVEVSGGLRPGMRASSARKPGPSSRPCPCR
jgi:2,4-dienoyl-CoA reductase-like NADH-dependent reductase (Old Yellow Enzyme family)